MNPLHEQIIRHALGLDHCKVPYRRHFIAQLITELRACETMMAEGHLIQLGRARRHGSTISRVFWVTEAGAALVGEKLP